MKSRDTYKVPAVVVGAGLNALGVVRSLARAGVPVTVLASAAEGPAMYTRYARKSMCLGAGSGHVIDALRQLGRTYGSVGVRPVLFLTQEETVAAFSRCRDELTNFFRITLPSSGVLATLMHKDGFRGVAEATGGLIPRTLRITDGAGLNLISGLRPPLVIKPSIRDRAYTSIFQKAYRMERVDDAQALVRQMLSVLPDVVVQEWIEGAESDIYFCLQFVRGDGEPAASFVGRKLRSWPPRVGGTASCTVAPDASHLNQTTTRFFREAGVMGLASMEYKREVRSGLFFMVEPTVGRTDYQEEVATLNGVNIPLAAYRAEIGLPQCPAIVSAKPRIWRDQIADRQAAMQGGDSEVDAWVGSGRVVDALWRPYDPMPAMDLLLRRIATRGRRLFMGATLAGKRTKDPA